jgi:hypothetical protein
MLVLLIEGIYELRRLDGIMWLIKVHEDWFWHSEVVRGDRHTDTQTAR